MGRDFDDILRAMPKERQEKIQRMTEQLKKSLAEKYELFSDNSEHRWEDEGGSVISTCNVYVQIEGGLVGQVMGDGHIKIIGSGTVNKDGSLGTFKYIPEGAEHVKKNWWEFWKQ